LFSGGKYFVPDESRSDFHGALAKGIAGGEIINIVEQRKEVFNFLVDVDMNMRSPVTDDQFYQIAMAIRDAVATFCDSPGKIIVSTAEPLEKVDKMGIKMYKSGLHMNWPELPVTADQAMELRYKILSFLDHYKVQPLEEEIIWPKVLDNSVYKGSGLRMMWTRKPEKHLICGPACTHPLCDRGKLMVRPYVPKWYTHNGRFHSYIGPWDYQRIINETALYTTQAANPRFRDVPTWHTPMVMNQGRLVKTGATYMPGEEEFKKYGKLNMVRDEEIINAALKAVRVAFKEFADILVPRYVYISASTAKRAYWVATSNRQCLYRGGSHASNCVYFNIRDGKVTQFCHDDECQALIQEDGHKRRITRAISSMSLKAKLFPMIGRLRKKGVSLKSKPRPLGMYCPV